MKTQNTDRFSYVNKNRIQGYKMGLWRGYVRATIACAIAGTALHYCSKKDITPGGAWNDFHEQLEQDGVIKCKKDTLSHNVQSNYNATKDFSPKL